MTDRYAIRYIEINRHLKESPLEEAQAQEYDEVVTSIFANPDKLEKFKKLFNEYHKLDFMNHVLFYFMKWRLFDTPPKKKSVSLELLHMDQYENVLFESSKKYYDNLYGLTNNYFTDNTKLKADKIDLTKIDPILAYAIPKNFFTDINKGVHEHILDHLKEHPEKKKLWQNKIKNKEYFVRDGWKRVCLARIQGKKKINAYCFDYFNRGSKEDIYILHEELYEKAKTLLN